MERKDEAYFHTHKKEISHEQEQHIHEQHEQYIHGYHKHEHEQHIHGYHEHGQHIHSDEEKKAVRNRLARAIGHLESVKRMVENDTDCSEVLIQLAAVRSAINNTGKLILKNHINECIVEAVEHGDYEAVEKLNEAIDKFMK